MRSAAVIPSFVLSFMLRGQSAWTFNGDSSATWEEAIARYEELDRRHRGASLITIGSDDDGSPIHLFVIADGGAFDPDSIRNEGRNILWITNGIHPGEPDGIDAGLMLAQALLESDRFMGLTVHTAVCIVPVYNVSGTRARLRPSRPDQNGPATHGIRSNARNLDLNREFVKMDSRNTQALVTALTHWDPDVYFETHVSDGADHRYVMELLTTQDDKLDPTLAAFMNDVVVPELYAWMDRHDMAMCPYFETLKDVPDSGLVEFNDGPRYSSGYNALFDRIGLLAESHMLKPFADRVNATFQLMLATLAVMDRHAMGLREARSAARSATASCASLGLNWELDPSRAAQIPFNGYAFDRVPSAVSGLPRLKYDRTRPVDLMVPWYSTYRPSLVVRKPKGYVVPQAWAEVVDRLRANGVRCTTIPRDSVMEAAVQHVDSMRTTSHAYEGHYLHFGVSTSMAMEQVQVRAGDLYVPMGHASDRFVMSVLEPACSDSYFAWGYFDEVMQQKEWFNDYVFDDIAAELLSRDAVLREAFHAKRAADPEFASDTGAQLNFILQRSPWAEQALRRYPVLRIEH